MNLDQYINESITNLDLLRDNSLYESFHRAVNIFAETIHQGGNILVCGNGGSYSDSLHFAAELVNYFTIEHRALPVIALGTNGSVATAWSNDHEFEDQFAREIEAYGNSRSILFGITTSGKSKNVNNAFNRAHNMGMRTIALTAKKAIPFLPSHLDNIIAVPVLETHKIQECHLVIYHALCIEIEQQISR